MKVRTEEVTRCYLNDAQIATLIRAEDLIREIRLKTGYREFGNAGQWNKDSLRDLIKDIDLLLLQCYREDHHEQK